MWDTGTKCILRSCQKLPKQPKSNAAAPFHYLSHPPFAAWSMLTHWIRHFPPMDLMDPDALAGNGSNAIWRDWRAGPWRITRWCPWTPFYPRPMLAIIFNAEKTIQLGGLTFPARSHLSVWIYRNAVPTFFSHLMHGRRKGWEKFPPRLNLRINFPKFFPHRVFSGNLGVEPSERFHICSNIGNPAPASLLFSNGSRVLDSWTSEYISPEFHFMFLRDGKERLLPLAA